MEIIEENNYYACTNNPKMREGYSVVVPVYNGELYVEECVRSLLGQTVGGNIILVNDGSTDRSGEICDQIAAENKNVRVIHQENAGASSARNAGIAVSQDEYIGFCDCDDTVHPLMYEQLLDKALKEDADCVCCDFRVISPGGRNKTVSIPYDEKLYSGEEMVERIIKPLLGFEHRNTDGVSALWNKLFKRTAITRHNLTIPPRQHGEDWAFLLEFLSKGTSMAFINQPLYNYYHRDGISLVNRYRDDYFASAVQDRFTFERLFPALPWQCEEKNIEWEQLPFKAFSYYRRYLASPELQKKAKEMLQLYREYWVMDDSTALKRAAKIGDIQYFYSILKKSTDLQHYAWRLKYYAKALLGRRQ